MDLIISPSESMCGDVKCNELIQKHKGKGAELFKHAQRNLESIAVKRKDHSGEKMRDPPIRVGDDVYVRKRRYSGRHHLLEQFELLRNESSRQCFYISPRRWSSENL